MFDVGTFNVTTLVLIIILKFVQLKERNKNGK